MLITLKGGQLRHWQPDKGLSATADRRTKSLGDGQADCFSGVSSGLCTIPPGVGKFRRSRPRRRSQPPR
ncbi:hypothetical protein ACNKHK_05085 [Shigella flexneri]